MDYYRAHGRSAILTCRYFGMTRQTFYRWRRRYGPHWLNSIEDRSRRPRHLREQYHRRGKDKLVVLLAHRLRVPRSEVRILRGRASRLKVVWVPLERGEVEARLGLRFQCVVR